MDLCRYQGVYSFPVLSVNDLVFFISDTINEKVKVADFSNASRLDFIIARLLFSLHGIRVNPEKPSVFIKFVLRFFQSIGCNVQPFDIFDFLPERDGKKWMRILSHLAQFDRNMQPVHNVYNQFIEDSKIKQKDALEMEQRLIRLRNENQLQQAKQTEYRQQISVLNTRYSEVSEELRKIKQSLQSSQQQLSYFIDSEKKDTHEIGILRTEVASLTERRDELKIRQIDNLEQLPELVEKLKQQINECELRVINLYQRGSLLDQSLLNFCRLETNIQQELVVDVEACQALLEKSSTSQTSLESLRRELTSVKETMAKNLREHDSLTEQVRLVDSAAIRRKMLNTKSKMENDATRKEKSTVLDNLCSKSGTLLQKVNYYTELVKSSTILYEEQHEDTERNENLKQIQDISGGLQTLFETFSQHSLPLTEP